MKYKYSVGMNHHGFGYSWDEKGEVEANSSKDAALLAIDEHLDWLKDEDWVQAYSDEPGSLDWYDHQDNRYYVRVEE